MKAKSNNDKCSRVVDAFLFTGATAVGIWSTMTFDQSKEIKFSQKMAHNIEICSTASTSVSSADVIQVK